jgi:hypothetical protein
MELNKTRAEDKIRKAEEEESEDIDELFREFVWIYRRKFIHFHEGDGSYPIDNISITRRVPKSFF